MTFYEAMQLGANGLKPIIKNTEDKKLRRKYISALIIKDFLCVLFCMVIVTSFNRIFGEDNSRSSNSYITFDFQIFKLKF